MMSAKEAKKKSEDNSVRNYKEVDSLIKALDLKVKLATEQGKSATDPITFPNTQVSPEALKTVEEKLKDLGYKVIKTEDYAYKTFTLSLSWNA